MVSDGVVLKDNWGAVGTASAEQLSNLSSQVDSCWPGVSDIHL